MLEISNEAIEIYEDVLLGRRRSFPRDFWSGETGKVRARSCTKYLIEKIFFYTEEDLKKFLRYNTFIDNKLSGMLRQVYGDSPFKAVDDIYNGKIKPWELKCCPMGFWDDELNRVKGIMWVLKSKGIAIENIYRDLTALMFTECGVRGLIDKYNGNLYQIIGEFNNYIKSHNINDIEY